jgi:hypothetical protein
VRGPGSRIAAALALLSLMPSTVPAAEPGPRHLIYLHGRIIQDQQSARPKHPQWGYCRPLPEWVEPLVEWAALR